MVAGRRLGRDVAAVLGLILVLYVAHIAASDEFAYDAHAYWAADGYGQTADTEDAFLYSPVALVALQAIGSVVSWPIFLEIYSLLIGLGVWLLAGPLTLLVVFTPQVASEITLANIHIFLAIMSVFGLRWPALWSFGLLTKVTPGLIGPVWFATRREWRKAAVPLVVAAALSLPTMILAPDLWSGWLRVLTQSPTTGSIVPIWLRMTVAIALTVLAARRDWPWMLPVTAMLALPILWSVHSLSMLVGVLPYVRRRFGGGSGPEANHSSRKPADAHVASSASPASAATSQRRSA